mgnify:CR=1 FL=1
MAFIESGNIYTIENRSATKVDDIPAGVYRIKASMQGLYLEKIEDDYKLPEKVYGDPTPRAERILNTWQSRTKNNTGVLLSGDKGSGKSLLMNILCHKAVEEYDAAVILVSDAMAGSDFTDFLSEIKRPLVVGIDEFEKVYGRHEGEAQKHILTTMDGGTLSGALFLLTVNDMWAVNSHMLNRPGRIYYHYKYAGLEEDFIREYCNDNLNNKELVDDIIPLTLLIESFSFDILKALVEELNRYGEKVSEVIKHLNVKTYGIESGKSTKIKVEIFDKNNVDVTDFFNEIEDVDQHPMLTERDYPFYIYPKSEDYDDDENVNANGRTPPETIKNITRGFRFQPNRDKNASWDKYPCRLYNSDAADE